MQRQQLMLSKHLPHPCHAQDRYERPRQAANVAMMGALDSLKRVFGVQAAPIAAIRSAGLGLLNAAAPVKNSIMRYAMGV